MRKFNVLVPSYLSDDINYVKQEIITYKKHFEECAEDSNSLEKRHLILLISTLTEQTLKSIRSDIVEASSPSDYIKKYFDIKNEKEPLYVKTNSAESIFNSFGKKSDNFGNSTIIERKHIFLFEDGSDFSSFESLINKNRNLAAHEVQPNFTLRYEDITKFFDYVLLFLEHYYSVCEKNFSINNRDTIFESINVYNEFFYSSKIRKTDVITIYTKNRSKKKIKEEFSEEEWEFIFRSFFAMHDDEKIDNIPLAVGKNGDPEFSSLLSKLSMPRVKRNLLSSEEISVLCSDLAKKAQDNRKVINHPIIVHKNKVYFGSNFFINEKNKVKKSKKVIFYS